MAPAKTQKRGIKNAERIEVPKKGMMWKGKTGGYQIKQEEKGKKTRDPAGI